MTKFTIWDPSLGERPANLALTNNFAATADPTVSNDGTQGYSPGSVWINTVDGRSFLMQSSATGAAVWALDNQAGGLSSQAAPVAATTSATLTAANLLNGIITVLQGGGANSAQQLPLASALDTALPQAVVNSSFDFSVTNLSVAAGETASITTNTGWTLVGSMSIDIETASSGATPSAGRFRARKTGTAAWSLYRIS
jgi:hypothetical protein